MTKSCYLAGPMRGQDLYNFPAFFEAAAVLRWHGWNVFNPAEMDMVRDFHPDEMMDSPHNSKVFDINSAFVKDFEAIMAGEAIFLLPGWRSSVGAQAEYTVARLTGKKCYEITTATLCPYDPPVLDYVEIETTLSLAMNL